MRPPDGAGLTRRYTYPPDLSFALLKPQRPVGSPKRTKGECRDQKKDPPQKAEGVGRVPRLAKPALTWGTHVTRACPPGAFITSEDTQAPHKYTGKIDKNHQKREKQTTSYGSLEKADNLPRRAYLHLDNSNDLYLHWSPSLEVTYTHHTY